MQHLKSNQNRTDKKKNWTEFRTGRKHITEFKIRM